MCGGREGRGGEVELGCLCGNTLSVITRNYLTKIETSEWK